MLAALAAVAGRDYCGGERRLLVLSWPPRAGPSWCRPADLDRDLLPRRESVTS